MEDATPPLEKPQMVGSVTHVLHTALDGLDSNKGAGGEKLAPLPTAGNLDASLARLMEDLHDKRSAQVQQDEVVYRAARERNLLPVTEYLLPPHTPGSLPHRSGVPIVSPSDVLQRVEVERLVRTGNMSVGSTAQDFAFTGEEAPHFMGPTPSSTSRLHSTVSRQVATVGGFGPAFHKTGALGVVDVPTTSGKSGLAVSMRDTGLVQHHSASASTAASKQFSVGATSRKRGTSPKKAVSFLPPSQQQHPIVGEGGFDGDAFDRELSKGTSEEPYASALHDGRAEVEAGEEAARLSLTASLSRHSSSASIQQQQQHRGHPAEGVTGTRGEGLAEALAKKQSLDSVRRGGKNGVKLEEAAVNAEAASRLSRPAHFLRNPRFLPASNTSLLAAGGGRRGGAPSAPSLPLPPLPLYTLPTTAQTEEEKEEGEQAHQQQQQQQFFTVGGGDGEDSLNGSVMEREGGGGSTMGSISMEPSTLRGYIAQQPKPSLASKGHPVEPHVIKARATDAGPSQCYAGPFLVSPASLTWLDYEPGDTKTLTLTLRNVDSLSRHIRFLPPTSRLFRVDTPIFPGMGGVGGMQSGSGVSGMVMPSGGATSVVAPGMVVRVSVTFSSLVSEPITDALTLVTEGGSFPIALKGVVPLPELNLPLTIPCAPTLCYDVTVVKLPVRNLGSTGTFQLLSPTAFEGLSLEREWDLGGGRGSHPNDGRLPLGPFAVWPTKLTLHREEEGSLTVLFSPHTPGHFSAVFLVVNNTGDVCRYTLEGEGGYPAVGIVQIQATPLPSPDFSGKGFLEGGIPDALPPPPPPHLQSPRELLAAIAAAVDANTTTTTKVEAAGGMGSEKEDAAAAVPQPPYQPEAGEEQVIESPPPPIVPYRVRFEDLYPGTFQTRVVHVRNDGPCPLNFKWEMASWDRAPQRVPLPVGCEWSSTQPPPPPPSMAFFVEPASGSLPPRSTTPFQVVFSPPPSLDASTGTELPQLGVYDAHASLTVLNLPRNPATVRQEGGAKRAALAAHAAGEALRLTGGAGVFFPPEGGRREGVAVLGGSSAGAGAGADGGEGGDDIVVGLSAFNSLLTSDKVMAGVAAAESASSAVEEEERREDSAHAQHMARTLLPLGGPTLPLLYHEDLPLVTLHCHGVSRPLDVIASPPVVALGPCEGGGGVGVGLRAQELGSGTLELVNRGDGQVVFIVDGVSGEGGGWGGSKQCISPPFGILPPRSSATLTVLHIPSLMAPPGGFNLDWKCMLFHASAEPRLAAAVTTALLEAQASIKEDEGGGSSSGGSSSSLATPLSGTWRVVEAYLGKLLGGGGGSESSPYNTHHSPTPLSARLPTPASTLTLRAAGEIVAPSVMFQSPPHLELGLVACASKTTLPFTLKNPGTAPLKWMLHRVRLPGERAGNAHGAESHRQPDEVESGSGSSRSNSSSNSSGSGSSVSNEELEMDSLMKSIAAGWVAFDDCDFPPDLTLNACNLVFSPSTGVLGPGEETVAEVTVVGGFLSQRLRAMIRALTVPLIGGGEEDEEGGGEATARAFQALPPHLSPSPSYLSLSGEIRPPHVTINASSLSLGVSFVNVPNTHTVVLRNLSQMPVPWTFAPYVGCLPPKVPTPPARKRGKHAKRVPLEPSLLEIRASLESGTLPPLGTATIDITITPRAPGLVNKAHFAFDIPGQSLPLACSITTAIMGPTLAYALVDDASGCVIPYPPTQTPLDDDDDASSSPSPEEHFSQHLTSIDPSLTVSPQFRAVSKAFTTALSQGALINRVPPLAFSGPKTPLQWEDAGEVDGSAAERNRERLPPMPHSHFPPTQPLPLLRPSTLSLHVYNLSGIPVDLSFAAEHLGVGGREGGGEGVNWPSLYSTCDSIAAGPGGGGGGGGEVAAAVAAAAGAPGWTPVFSTPPPFKYSEDLIKHARVEAYGLQSGGGGGGASLPPPSFPTATAANTKGGMGPTLSAPPRPLLGNSHEATFRFSSAAGRALVASQEFDKVNARLLGAKKGASIGVYPPQIDLPPFGHAVVSIIAIADVPGVYRDTVTVREGGGKLPPLHIPTSLFAVGNPISVLPGNAGLQCAPLTLAHLPPPLDNGFRAGPPIVGTRATTLSFGDLPVNSLPTSHTITLKNASPLDALITFYTHHDRAPFAEQKALALELGVVGGEEGEEEGAEGKEGGVKEVGVGEVAMGGEGGGEREGKSSEESYEGLATTEEGGVDAHESMTSSTLSLTLRVATDRKLSPSVPLAFKVYPRQLLVPALGTASLTITGDPRAVTDEDRGVAVSMGWCEGGEMGAAEFLRGRVAGDAIFLPQGTPPPQALLDLASRPQTPGPLGVLSGGSVGSSSRDVALALGGEEGGEESGRKSPNPSQTFLVRDILTVHTILRPYTLRLLVNKGSLEEDGATTRIKWGVWSVALAEQQEAAAKGMGGGGGKAVGGSGAAAARGRTLSTPPTPFLHGFHPSCIQEVTLTNPAGIDALFSLSVAGPFTLVSAVTSAPPAPSTRPRVGVKTLGAGAGAGGYTSSSTSSTSSPLYNLPPGTGITLTLAFNPQAGSSERMTAASLLLAATAPSHALASTSLGEDAALTSTLRLTGAVDAGTMRLGNNTYEVGGSGGGGGPILPDPTIPTPQGTLTLGASMGAAGAVGVGAGDAVTKVMVASLARLRGDYVGSVTVQFGGGGGGGVGGGGGGNDSGRHLARPPPVTQTLRLHAQVLRPALLVGPPQLAFGIVRASVKGKGVGGGDEVLGSGAHFKVITLFLSNPTSVPATWSIKHIPAPPATLSEKASTHAAAARTSTGLLPNVVTLGEEAGGGGVVDATTTTTTTPPLPWSALGLEPEKAWAKPPLPTPPTDDPSVFSFAALSGTVVGPTSTPDQGVVAPTRTSKGVPAPLPLDVRFVPRANVVYQSRFRFCVQHGESFEVTLSGRGTYEEV